MMIYKTYHNYWDATVDHTYIAEYATCTSSPLLPLGNGSPVFFDHVCETVEENGQILGKTDYTFSNGMLNDFYLGETITLSNTYPGLLYSGINDEGYCVPLLTQKKHYDYNGTTVLRTEDYDYSGTEIKTFNYGTKLLSVITASFVNGDPVSLQPSHIQESYILFRSLTAHCKTFSQITKTVTDNQLGISTTETYSYDSLFRTLNPKTITTTNSDGKTFRTVNEYTFDCSDAICREMADSYFMTDQVVATRQYCGSTLLRTDSTLFFKKNDWFYPQYKYEQLAGGSLTEKLHFAEYDDSGNPLTVIANQTDVTALVWGFKSTLPVARVSGLAYSYLQNQLGLAGTLASIAVDSIPSRMAGYLTTLRTGIAANGPQAALRCVCHNGRKWLYDIL